MTMASTRSIGGVAEIVELRHISRPPCTQVCELSFVDYTQVYDTKSMASLFSFCGHGGGHRYMCNTNTLRQLSGAESHFRYKE